MSRTALGTKTKRGSRTFRLTVQSDGDTFGVTLVEADAKDASEHVIARTSPKRTRDVTTALQRALKDSGHAKTTLSSRRKRAIPLHEDAGVRLALTMFATDGVKKGRRKTTMMTAIETMATEEAYYWYAKCVGQDGPRVRRALRLFLAEE